MMHICQSLCIDSVITDTEARPIIKLLLSLITCWNIEILSAASCSLINANRWILTENCFELSFHNLEKVTINADKFHALFQDSLSPPSDRGARYAKISDSVNYNLKCHR